MNKPGQETKYLRSQYLPAVAQLALDEFRRATIGPRSARNAENASYWRGMSDGARHLANRLDLKYPGGFPGVKPITALPE